MANNNEKETFDAAVKSEAFFEKNKKVISGVIIAIILVVAGVLCYNQFIGGPRQQKASTALARGQEYFNADQFDKALNGDGAGYTGFVKIADDYSSTDAGNLANLYAGLCYANLGKWQDAVKYLEAYSPKGDAMVSPAAIEALGNAYAHVGQIDKAISTLKEAASRQTTRLRMARTTVFLLHSCCRPVSSSSRRTRSTRPTSSTRTSRRNMSTLLSCRATTSTNI
jgi:hypothetical protein